MLFPGTKTSNIDYPVLALRLIEIMLIIVKHMICISLSDQYFRLVIRNQNF